MLWKKDPSWLGRSYLHVHMLYLGRQRDWAWSGIKLKLGDESCCLGVQWYWGIGNEWTSGPYPVGLLQRVIRMWSLLPKLFPQLGHFLDRLVSLSSTQSLQKVCPQVLMTVFFKARLHMLQ